MSAQYAPTIGPDLYTCPLNTSKKTVQKFKITIRMQLYDVPHAEV